MLQKSYEEALSVLDLLIDDLKQPEYDAYYISALLSIGICCFEIGQLDKSWISLKEGLTHARKNNDPNTIAEFLHEMSIVAYKSGDLVKSLNLCKES